MKKSKSKKMAAGAVFAGLGVTIMILGGLIPVMTYVSPLIASLCLIPVLDMSGSVSAIIEYLVISVCSLLLSPDKEAGIFFLFFGWYPILKPSLDRIRSKLIRVLLKLGIFTAASAVMYFLACYVLGIEDIINSFTGSKILNVLLVLIITPIMYLYDISLNNLIFQYKTRIKTKMKWL